MILASLGINRTEAEIGKILGTRDYGTPSFAIKNLAALGVLVEYREWSINELLAQLDAGYPVILFVRTGFLDYWTTDVAHAAVIVTAIENEKFLMHDPAFVTGPTSVSWDGLLVARAEFGYLGATIVKERTH